MESVINEDFVVEFLYVCMYMGSEQGKSECVGECFCF